MATGLGGRQIKAPQRSASGGEPGTAEPSSPAGDRRIFIESLLEQNVVYLLNDTATRVEKEYELRDYSGEFPDDETALANGTVYVGSNDGDVFALEASDGNVSWSATLSTAVLSAPAVANGTVYVTTDGGELVALNATDGAQRWTVSTGADLGHTSPLVADGRVYLAADAIHAVAPNGTVLWTTPYGGTVGSTPAYDGGRIFVGSADGNVYALNATTGSIAWTTATGGAVGSSPAVAGDRLVVGSDDGTVYVLNTETGFVDGTASIGRVRSTPAIADDVAYVGTWNGSLYALNNVIDS